MSPKYCTLRSANHASPIMQFFSILLSRPLSSLRHLHHSHTHSYQLPFLCVGDLRKTICLLDSVGRFLFLSAADYLDLQVDTILTERTQIITRPTFQRQALAVQCILYSAPFDQVGGWVAAMWYRIATPSAQVVITVGHERLSWLFCVVGSLSRADHSSRGVLLWCV
jgi:hypothetical protein